MNISVVVGSLPKTGAVEAPFIFDDGDKGGSITYDKVNGWLYIDLRKHFNVALRVGDWSRKLQVFEWDPTIGEWVAANRDPGLPFMVCVGKGDDPVQAYLQTVPPEVLKAVAPFKWRSFVLMQMLLHVPEWDLLIRENPILVLLVADTMSRNDQDVRVFSNLVFERRTRILEACGFPHTKSVVRLLSRIRFDSYSLIGITDVRKAVLYPETASIMQKIECIDGSCLRFLLQNTDMFKYPFVRRRIAVTDKCFKYEDQLVWFQRMRETVTDIRRMGEQLRVEDVNRTLMHCAEDTEVQRIHDEWAIRMNRLNVQNRADQFNKKHNGKDFPAPPFPGNDFIVPITSFADLQEESVFMHHCVGSYADSVMLEFSYIYRILSPERATLELSLDIEHNVNAWCISQLKLMRNAEPSNETKAAVAEWLMSQKQPDPPDQSEDE